MNPYRRGETVIERVGEGEDAPERNVTIVWEGGKGSERVVVTETGLEYDAGTGMRTNKAEPYRSIRRPRLRARRLERGL